MLLILPSLSYSICVPANMLPYLLHPIQRTKNFSLSLEFHFHHNSILLLLCLIQYTLLQIGLLYNDHPFEITMISKTTDVILSSLPSNKVSHLCLHILPFHWDKSNINHLNKLIFGHKKTKK